MIQIVTVLLFSFMVTGTTGDFKLRVVHTNDMHARFEQVSRTGGKCIDSDAAKNLCYGGFARVKTIIDREIKRADEEKMPIVVLNAGDSFQGTVWYAFFKWSAVAAFIKYLKFDALSLGNHEFDDGIKGLSPYLEALKIPVLACNIDASKEKKVQPGWLKKSIVLEKSGLKIGVVGYITTEAKSLADTGNLVFNEEIPAIRKEVKRMKGEGIKVIICLGHSGLDVDKKIAAEVDEVDIIVGGHSHSFLYTGKKPDIEDPVDVYPVIVNQKGGRKVAIVQAYVFTKYVGILDVIFNDKGELKKAVGNPILLSSKIPQDEEVMKEIKLWKDKLTSSLKEKVGESRVFLDAYKCRFYECNFGNLIADGLIYHGVITHKGPYWTNAPIAITQSGGIRAPIDAKPNKGIMTREDLITSMPFFGSVSVVQIRGQYLMEALEWSVARYDLDRKEGRGEFLQYSGLKIVYDLTKPSGERVMSVRVKCSKCNEPKFEDFRRDAVYTVIMPTFLYKGGDSYVSIKNHAKEIKKLAVPDTNLTIDYITHLGTVYTGEEDRIFLIDAGINFKPNYLFITIISLVIYFFK